MYTPLIIPKDNSKRYVNKKTRFAQTNVLLKIPTIMGWKANTMPETSDSNPKAVAFYLKIVNCIIEESQHKRRKGN